MVNKVTFPKLLNTAYVQSFSRVNIVTGFQSTGICDWDPLAILVKGFSTYEPFEQPNSRRAPPQWVVREINTPRPSAVETFVEPESEASNEDDSCLSFSPDFIDQEGNVIGQLVIENDDESIPIPHIEAICCQTSARFH